VFFELNDEVEFLQEFSAFFSRRSKATLLLWNDFMQLRISVWLSVLILISGVVCAEEKPVSPQHSKEMAAGLALFKSQVRPVLVKQCVRCHGGEDTEAEFDLTTRELLLQGGENGAAIEVGKANSSRMMKLLQHEIEPEMPMDASKLPAAEIAAIAKWIDLGAPYDAPLVDGMQDKTPWTQRVVDVDARKYWAFQPLGKHEPPTVPTVNKNLEWPRSDIDRFLLRKLNTAGVTPNPLAEKRELIRRAYFDLIGLPPTSAEVTAFLQDNSDNAYEKVIDRLLASEHYGERWGRHWLDVARFAESHGFEQDYDRPHAYHYRDFVIKALNSDMPFDQFVRWQLAGDELAPDDPLAMMATGFLGAGVFPTQLTEKEFEPARYDELADMTGTTGVAMLGMTIGCARCHDHKFDPIPQADFYRMSSSFTTAIRSEIDIETPAVGLDAYLAKHQKLVDALHQYEKEQLTANAKKWLANLKPSEEKPPVWRIVNFKEAKSEGGATFIPQQDGSLLATGKSPTNDRYTFVVETTEPKITAVRLEALADASLKRKGPGRASNGNFALSNLRVTATPLDGSAKQQEVKLTNARATFQQNTGSLSVAGSIDGDPVSGWAVDPQFGKDHAAVFDFAAPVALKGGVKLTFTLHFNNNVHHSIGRPRLSLSSLPQPPIDGESSQRISNNEILKLVKDAGGFDKLSEPNRQTVLTRYRNEDQQWTALDAAVKQSWAKRPQGQKLKVMATTEGSKPLKHHADGRGFTHFFKETYFLERGDINQKQGVAPQGFLQVLNRAPDKEDHWRIEPPTGARTSYRRAALATWMTDTEYGAGDLVARVIVNRMWQHHFGRGIVATPNDFGRQSEPPSHPELLDWLANQLIENDWRMKPIHKLMMTSAAYRQSSKFQAAASKEDPKNHLLWRFSPRRLEAEVIRDSILSVSGELDPTMFGKGTLNEAMKRRSIYFFIKRSRLIPMMQLFDSPEALVSIGDRPATTIAPQALMFMNNPQVRSYARAFAKKLNQTHGDSLEDAVRSGYMSAIARQPTKSELAETTSFLQSQIASYEKEKRGDARELALADFCQVLFSLNEFIYVE